MANQQRLGEYMVQKVGLRRATGVAAFVVAWGVYMEKTQPPYTLDAYSKYWRQSLTKTYRERDDFRLCFADDKTPERIWGICRQVYDGKVDERRRDLTSFRVMSLSGAWA